MDFIHEESILISHLRELQGIENLTMEKMTFLFDKLDSALNKWLSQDILIQRNTDKISLRSVDIRFNNRISNGKLTALLSWSYTVLFSFWLFNFFF